MDARIERDGQAGKNRSSCVQPCGNADLLIGFQAARIVMLAERDDSLIGGTPRRARACENTHQCVARGNLDGLDTPLGRNRPVGRMDRGGIPIGAQRETRGLARREAVVTRAHNLHDLAVFHVYGEARKPDAPRRPIFGQDRYCLSGL